MLDGSAKATFSLPVQCTSVLAICVVIAGAHLENVLVRCAVLVLGTPNFYFNSILGQPARAATQCVVAILFIAAL